MAHAAPIGEPVLAGTSLAPAGEPEPVLEKLSEPASAPLSSPAAEPEPPSLVDTFKVKLPEDPSATLVRVVENTRIAVGGKRYLLQAGDIFVLDRINAGQVAFQANELRLSLPERAVEIMAGQSPEPDVVDSVGGSASIPAERPPAPQPPAAASDKDALGSITSRAQAEAIRRYPAIGLKRSPENEIFLARFNRLKAERPEFFEVAERPIYLAEAVAKEEGWQRVK